MVVISGDTPKQRLINALNNIEALDERIETANETIRKAQNDLDWAVTTRRQYLVAAEKIAEEVFAND